MSSYIKDQLNQIRDTLDEWGEENGFSGHVFVVSDIVHMWKQLFDSSQYPKLLIMYNGEQVRGEFGIAAPLARVDRRFMVVVSRGRSMNINPGDALTETNQNSPPLFEQVEEVRDICRAMIFDPDWNENPVDYLGVTPFPTENSGRLIDAYQIEFSIGSQLHLIVSQPDS